MKYLAYSIILFFAISCGNKSEKTESTSLTAKEFQEKLTATSSAMLLDVRTPDEVRNGAIQSAVNFDYNAPEFDILIKGLDPSKTYFVYCASGVRSNNAAKKLRELNFKVYTLEGGLNAWKAEGLPLR